MIFFLPATNCKSRIFSGSGISNWPDWDPSGRPLEGPLPMNVYVYIINICVYVGTDIYTCINIGYT
jgi:hypothetical protein